MDKLFLLAQKGSKRAFKELFDYYGPINYGYIMNQTDSESVSEDVFEAVWLETYREIEAIEQPLNVYIMKKTCQELIRIQNLNDSELYHEDRPVKDDAYSEVNNRLLNLSDDLLSRVLEPYFDYSYIKEDDEDLSTVDADTWAVLFPDTETSVHKDVEDITSNDVLNTDARNSRRLSLLFKPMLPGERSRSEILNFVVYKRKKYITLVVAFIILLSCVVYVYKDRIPVINQLNASSNSSQESSDIIFEDVPEVEKPTVVAEINMSSKEFEAGVLYLEFDIEHMTEPLSEDSYMRVTLINDSHHSYILKRTDNQFSFPYDVSGETLDEEILAFSASLICEDALVTSKEFDIDLSEFAEWSRVYVLDEMFDTGHSQIHFKSLEMRGPFIRLYYDESADSVDRFRYYHIEIEDDHKNRYSINDIGWDMGSPIMETGAVEDYRNIHTLTIHLLHLRYDELEVIGEIKEDHLTFTYRNREYFFEIIRNDDEPVHFVLSTDEVIDGGEFPILRIRQDNGWFNLNTNQGIDTAVVTAADYYNVYETEGDQTIDIDKMIEYYDKKYGKQLDGSHLSSVMPKLPEGANEVEVMIKSFKTKELSYQSYFGDTTQPLELAISHGEAYVELMKSFVVDLEQ